MRSPEEILADALSRLPYRKNEAELVRAGTHLNEPNSDLCVAIAAIEQAQREAIEAMVELAATKRPHIEAAVRELADELLPHREGQ